MRPVDWLDEKILTPLTGWVMRREELAVRDGVEGAQRIYWAMLARLAAVAVGVAVYDYVPRLVQDLLVGTLCGALAIAALAGMNRARAYKRGWLEGRQRMRDEYRAHRGRGSSVEDWLDTEFHYDATHVQGLPALPPPRGPMD